MQIETMTNQLQDEVEHRMDRLAETIELSIQNGEVDENSDIVVDAKILLFRIRTFINLVDAQNRYDEIFQK